MANIASELFLLFTNLSQFKSKVLITKLFIESINALFVEHEFSWSAVECDIAETKIQVCTRYKNYGYIYFNKKSAFTDENFSLLQNAVQMLALQLEKIDQEELLKDQKMHLSIMVQEKTKDLIESQNELIKQNKEIERQNKDFLKAKKQAEKNENELKKVQGIAHIGSWHMDSSTNEVVWTDELYKMYGFDASLPVPPYTEHMKLFTPESWEILSTSLAKTSETGIPYELELKTLRKDGSNGWMWVRGEPVTNSEGKNIGLWGAAQDITERKRYEYMLVESEAKYLAAITQSPVGIAMVGLDNRFIYCNSAFINFIGFSEQELIGKTIADITYPEDLELGMHEMKEMVEGKNESVNIQKRYLRKDGEIVWGNLTISIVRDAANEPIYFLPIIQDITQRKQAEERLKSSEEQFRNLYENATLGIYRTTPEGKILLANPFLIEMLGYNSFEELSKINLIDQGFVLDFPRSKFITSIEREGSIHAYESVWKRKDGSSIIISESARVQRDSSGKILYYEGMVQDITVRKQVENELLKAKEKAEKSEAKFRNLFENMNDAFGLHKILTDKNGKPVDYRFIEVNSVFAARIGMKPEDLINHTTLELFPKTEQSWIDIFGRVALTGESIQHTNYSVELDKYYETRIYCPEPGYFAVLFSDITERIKTQNELIAAKERAEESDSLKSAFLANMSHEIRTPLNSILGFTELICDPHSKMKQRLDYAQLITSSGNNLLSIINDILDISKIEAGQVRIRKTLFSAQNLILDVQKEFEFSALEKGISLIIAPSTPVNAYMLESDEPKLKQILTNFVSNAIKFTDIGFIEIGMKVIENLIQFHVKDTGIGIRIEFQNHIFERFRQVETFSTRKYGGNGLGLPISKSLVEMLGGTIWVDSELGKGSTFYFSLPTV